MYMMVFTFQNEKTKAELLELYKENKVEDLHHRLCSRMAFGTAGRNLDPISYLCMS